MAISSKWKNKKINRNKKMKKTSMISKIALSKSFLME